MQPLRTDRAEVERLCYGHGPELLLFATAIVGDRGRAQDIVHQVFLKLLENGNLGAVANVRAYLFTCVRNAILNDIRICQRSVPLEEDSAWFDPPDRDYTAELNLRVALSALPDDQRQVVVLHIWGELTFLQIADVLGISPNAAASRYRYAVAKLRELMHAKEDSCANPF